MCRDLGERGTPDSPLGEAEGAVCVFCARCECVYMCVYVCVACVRDKRNVLYASDLYCIGTFFSVENIFASFTQKT